MTRFGRVGRLATVLGLSVWLVAGCVASVADGPADPSAQRSGSEPTGWPTVSGVAPPDSDLPGFDLVFTDDFGRSELGADYSAYEGSPGGDPYSQWSPEHVRLRDGLLVLEGYREDGAWLTGGVSNWPQAQTYGRWEVRFRAEPSDEITYHFLLWPQSDQWPPEIDFAEDFGGDRSAIAAFVHYLDGGQRERIQRDLSDVDFTTWQTVGVEWRPDGVHFLLNGEVWSEVDSDHVPDEPMWLALQAQSGGCARKSDFGFPDCPVVGVPDHTEIAVDWVAVYALR